MCAHAAVVRMVAPESSPGTTSMEAVVARLLPFHHLIGADGENVRLPRSSLKCTLSLYPPTPPRTPTTHTHTHTHIRARCPPLSLPLFATRVHTHDLSQTHTCILLHAPIGTGGLRCRFCQARVQGR
jgi:hypothetical protein